MKSRVDGMVQKENPNHLIHGESIEVLSHVQRFNGDCMLNTLMIDGYDCPFIYCRKRKYQNLTGKLVDLAYYPSVELLAGFEVDIMKVVQIKAV